MTELKLQENIIDNELLETPAEGIATENEETKEATTLKNNEEAGKSLESEIKKALKSLKDQKLSKEEYEAIYENAFEKAKSLLEADAELAEKFKNLPTEDGFRSDKYKLKGGETATKTKTRILEIEYGLKYKQAWEIQQIDKDLVEQTITEARKQGELPTRKLALKIARKKRSEENKWKKLIEKQKSFADIHQSEAIKLDGDKYNIIYANPVYESEESDKTLAISIEEMKKLQIPSDNNAVLFLWTTSEDLISSLEVVSAWGFTYREHAIWDFVKTKKTHFCFEARHKVLLVATKGDSLPEPELIKASVFQERSERTDLKPRYYYEVIERMFPSGAYLDVFAKEPFNSKWTTFFNNKEEE